MKFAIIGCGYVADHYLRTLGDHPILELTGVTDLKADRSQAVSEHYGTKAYKTNEDVWRDPSVELVVILTNPQSHYELTKASLLAGKHVYCEKPFTLDIPQAQELVELADKKGLLLSGAPCNVLGNSAQATWQAVRDGAAGRVEVVYAEFDDNPVYLMKPEGWASLTGAPWPYLHEYEMGCTLEHAGYYLTWLAAMFGPAVSVTAFSSCLVPDKTPLPLNPSDTPDFSVACIVYESGVVARLTCSIVAPMDHRLRIIGNEGMINVDTYRNFQSPIYVEPFSQLTLNARKSRSVRARSWLQALLGVEGSRQPLPMRPGGTFRRKLRNYLKGRPPILGPALKDLKLHELGAQDKMLGVVDMAEAVRDGRPCLLPPDLVVHVTELTLAISSAGIDGGSFKPKTTFKPLNPRSTFLEPARDYGKQRRQRGVAGFAEKLIARLHRHGR